MQLDDLTGASCTPKPFEAREESPNDSSRPAQRAMSENPLLAKWMLEFDKSRGVRVQSNGLCLPDGMSYDCWRDLGCQVALVANCSAWWLGDWLVYGEETYDDRYDQAIADTSLGYKTLRNYAWVARRFPVSRRRDTLS